MFSTVQSNYSLKDIEYVKMPKDNNTVYMAAHGVSFVCTAALGLFTWSQVESLKKQIEEIKKRLESVSDVTTDPVEKEKFTKALTQLRDQMTSTNQNTNGNFEQIKNSFGVFDRRIKELEKNSAKKLTPSKTPAKNSPDSDDDNNGVSPIRE
jgi:DNA anti-recombination protein RmuC